MPMTQSHHNVNAEILFASLFETYKERMFNYVIAVTHSRYTAEEITQEIFVKLWLGRETLHTVANPEAYLFTIARNKTLNYFRKARYDHALIAELKSRMRLCSNNVDDQLNLADSDRLLQEAITLLSPQRQ